MAESFRRYVVQLGIAPGDWQPYSGIVHETREAAVAEIDAKAARHPDARVSRSRNGDAMFWDPRPVALRIKVITNPRVLPRRQVTNTHVVAPPALRKRASINA